MSAAREPSGTIAQRVSCLDGYDPDALRVDKAGEAIRACLTPVAETETRPGARSARPRAGAGDRAADQRSGARQFGDGWLGRKKQGSFF